MSHLPSNRSSLSPRIKLLGFGVVGLFALVQACSSDGGNSSPSDIPVITAGSGGSAGKGGSGGSSNGGSANAGSNNGGNSQGGSSHAGTGGAAGEAGEAGGGSTPITCDPAATGPDGCFKCPDTDIKFLNQCTASHCSPFDNTKLGLHGATLPPLPG